MLTSRRSIAVSVGGTSAVSSPSSGGEQLQTRYTIAVVRSVLSASQKD